MLMIHLNINVKRTTITRLANRLFAIIINNYQKIDK